MQQLKFLIRNKSHFKRYNTLCHEMSLQNVTFHPCQRSAEGKLLLNKCLKKFYEGNKKFSPSSDDFVAGLSVGEVSHILTRLEDRPISAGISSSEPFKLNDDDDGVDYIQQQHFELIQRYLYVRDHNFGEKTDGTFFVVCRWVVFSLSSLCVLCVYSRCLCPLSPRMALDTAKEAAKMYGGKIQIELDFFKLKLVKYQVGHLGVSDMAHRYNLLCFSLFDSENQANTIRLLETALELIELAKGKIEFILVDGGKALKAAVEEFNLGQRGKELVEAIIKVCFRHNM